MGWGCVHRQSHVTMEIDKARQGRNVRFLCKESLVIGSAMSNQEASSEDGEEA